MSGSAVRGTGDWQVDDRDRRFLRLAFADAERAAREGERPFAAIVVSPGDEVLAAAINRQESTGDFTEHAELNALRQASAAFPAQVRGATLYASSEPCAMCSAGAYFAGVGRVVFGTSSAGTYELLPRPGCQLTMGAAAVLATGDRPTTVIGPVLVAEGLAHLRRTVTGGTAAQHPPTASHEKGE